MNRPRKQFDLSPGPVHNCSTVKALPQISHITGRASRQTRGGLLRGRLSEDNKWLSGKYKPGLTVPTRAVSKSVMHKYQKPEVSRFDPEALLSSPKRPRSGAAPDAPNPGYKRAADV